MKQILIVDDNVRLRKSVLDALLERGYSVADFGNVEDAEYFIRETYEKGETFALILIDLDMGRDEQYRDYGKDRARFSGHLFLERLLSTYIDVADEIAILSGHIWYREQLAHLVSVPFISKFDGDMIHEILNLLEGKQHD